MNLFLNKQVYIAELILHNLIKRGLTIFNIKLRQLSILN